MKNGTIKPLLLIYLERIYSVAGQINISDEMADMVNQAIEECFQSRLNFQELAAKAGVTLEHLGRYIARCLDALSHKP